MNWILPLLCIPFSLVLWGWAGATMWAWFAPVVYAGLPMLSIGQVIAARILYGALTGPPRPTGGGDDKDGKQVASNAVINAFALPPVVVAIAWVVHLFLHAAPAVQP